MTPESRPSITLLCFLCLEVFSSGLTATEIVGSSDEDTLTGTDGKDEIIGGRGNDILNGGAGGDVLRGGQGDDVLIGGTGLDRLYGGVGDDVLRGGEGDDVLIGGIGLDRLYGGPGADQFVFDLGQLEVDEIMDFDPEQGDTVWLQLGQSVKNDKLRSVFNELNSEDVRVDSDGDLEIELENEVWIKVVKLKQANVKVGLTRHQDKLLLHFSREF